MSRVPRIRFKGFEEDWEQRKLWEIAERIIRKNEKMESTLPLTISAQYGLIDQNEFFDKRIASKDVRGYYLIKKGEFAYNKSTSVDAPLGAIKRLDKYKNGVLSTLYILFKIIDDTSTSSDYLVTYYSTDLWHKEIQSIAAEGARNHGLLNIAPDDFFETMISIPLNVFEQKKVGELFQILDHLITLHQSKFFGDILKTIASYTLYWEQRKLGEVAIFSKGVGYSKSDLKDSGIPIILYGRLYTNYEIVIKDVDTFADGICGAVYSKGGEIITPSSGETSEDISIASVVKKSGVLLGGDLNIIYPQSFLNPIFIAISISNGKPHKEMAKRAQGKSVVHLHNVDLSKIEIDYPSIDEQTRISSYFISLDHLITLHQLEPFQLIFKAIAYRIIDYAKSKPPRRRKYTGLISFIKCYV